jgi:hypothetical protein
MEGVERVKKPVGEYRSLEYLSRGFTASEASGRADFARELPKAANAAKGAWVGADLNRSKTVSLTRFARS